MQVSCVVRLADHSMEKERTFKDYPISSDIAGCLLNDSYCDVSLNPMSGLTWAQNLPRISLGGNTTPSGGLLTSSGSGVAPLLTDAMVFTGGDGETRDGDEGARLRRPADI